MSKMMGLDHTKSLLTQPGRWEARTGALRYVERIVSIEMPEYGEDIMQSQVVKTLQQEFAVIERDKHGIEKRSFEWHDVPLVEE
jgi:hypothetical protein